MRSAADETICTWLQRVRSDETRSAIPASGAVAVLNITRELSLSAKNLFFIFTRTTRSNGDWPYVIPSTTMTKDVVVAIVERWNE